MAMLLWIGLLLQAQALPCLFRPASATRLRLMLGLAGSVLLGLYALRQSDYTLLAGQGVAALAALLILRNSFALRNNLAQPDEADRRPL